MKAVINGKIVLENEVLENGCMIFGEKIEKIGKCIDTSGCDIINANGNYVIPGLVDVHIHGYKGFDVSDANRDDICKMARLLPENGVTSWCPTTMTVEKSVIEKCLEIIGELKNSSLFGARILGANVEGPFINPQKKGAQSEKFILKPDSEFILKYKNSIKLVTVAPEMDDNCNFIGEVSKNSDINISVGHTNASYKQTVTAFENGANHITHLFNAMPPLNHRDVGVVGAALENDNVYCELIADTFHINPALFKTLERVKRNKLVLITDCMRAGGMSDGEYFLGGQRVTVSGIECRLADGTIAGSILTLNKAVKNYMEYTNIDICEAIKKASLYPARSVGADSLYGSLCVGKYADFAIADGDINIEETYVGGKCVFRA